MQSRKLWYRRRFWMPIAVAYLVAIGLWARPWLVWVQSVSHARDPILTGPPAFILLALVIAFAVYLRQVSNRVEDQWTTIRINEARPYPLGESHTNDKLEGLTSTYDQLVLVAPFLIFVSIVLLMRLVFESILRFYTLPRWTVLAWTLPLVDFEIIAYLAALFIILGTLHYRARKNDKKVRRLTHSFLERKYPIVLRVENHSEPRQDCAARVPEVPAPDLLHRLVRAPDPVIEPPTLSPAGSAGTCLLAHLH